VDNRPCRAVIAGVSDPEHSHNSGPGFMIFYINGIMPTAA
jgi:hypothetical protein